jgi:hypothetical protein
MANGDYAAAHGIPPVPPTALVKMGYDEINRSLDLIVWEDDQIRATVHPIAKGGTGATTAAQAKTNLGLPNVAVSNDGAGVLTLGAIGGNRVHIVSPGYVTDNTLAYLGDVTALSAELLPVIEGLQALVETLQARVAALEKKPK